MAGLAKQAVGTRLGRRCSHDMSKNNETYAKPSDVVAEEGRVLVDGPDSVDVAMTPEAAIESCDRMIEEGMRANGQLREKTIDHRPK